MPIEEAIERLTVLVESADTKPLLQCIDNDEGHAVELAAVPEGPERAFELVTGSGEDGGEGGCEDARMILRVRLRVRFRLAGSRRARMAAMQATWKAIRNATARNPGGWLHGTTGIVTIDLGPFVPEALTTAGQVTPTHEALSAEFYLEVDP